tara:strand:+ start:1234 stop:2076 length:843 start_codon:yes stop_codon:yes gene_type:complete
MLKINIYIILFLLILFTSRSFAVVVNATGEYVLTPDISETECFNNAKQRALNNAAAALAGEKLVSETMKVCEASFETAQCELYQSSWSVIDAVSRKGGVKIINREKVNKNIYENCEVTIEVDLYKTPKPDPNFDFSFEINQSKFLAGHKISLEDNPLKITIRPFDGKKMFINIFHWTPYEDGKNVNRIFPRPEKEKYDGKINLISSESVFPRESSGYSWRSIFPKDHKRESVSEGILVFASKDDLQFAHSYTYEHFQEKLLEISNKNSRTKKTIYVIIEK